LVHLVFTDRGRAAFKTMFEEVPGAGAATLHNTRFRLKKKMIPEHGNEREKMANEV
jgi:hypothetical protein